MASLKAELEQFVSIGWEAMDEIVSIGSCSGVLSPSHPGSL